MNKGPCTLYIDGKFVQSLSGDTRTIIDPFNGQTIAKVAEGGREDARSGIEAARRAFEKGDWPELEGIQRGDLLDKFAESIEVYSEELAILETQNTGKTLEESRWDMADIVGIFRYYAEYAGKDQSETITSPLPHSVSEVVCEPVGVCGQISPWNYPLLQAVWKLAPALAAGCTVVMKPSEITPLSIIRLVELADELHFPPGVINLVLGPGATVGAELAENVGVDLISFTGGIETGKSIMKAASSNVKKIALELGGKNPHIIFADADLDIAVDHVLNGVFFHAGQICSAGSRLMLEESIHDYFVAKLKKRMVDIRLGSGMEPHTQMGPVISEAHLTKVESYMELAKEDGAVLELGGKRPKDSALRDGFFFLPTLFTGCNGGMRIVQEEIFGPVITVEKFKTEDEVVEEANNTIFGLAAGFWTSDEERMKRVAKKLRFGTVWINDFNVYFTEAPWGGYKQSGLGRELGSNGLEEYQEIKHIFTNTDPEVLRWFGIKR